MQDRSNQTRRHFLQHASLGAVGVCLAGAKLLAAEPPAGDNKICAFTKPFHKLRFDALADRIAEIGFDGIEAPVRPGGHIEPADAERELPRLVEELRKRNLEIGVMASGIKGLDEPHTKPVLKTAADLGIKKYRLAYYQYDLNRPIVEQVRELRPALRDLVAYSKELGILPLYQNHSGAALVGAPVWDLHELFSEISTD
jgi:sugar phosphate isomerase/epimerase